MKFKQIIIFSIGAYNKNKEKDGRLPQDGTIINVFQSQSGINSVAVGFDK